jgi:P-type Mg2+ transporter
MAVATSAHFSSVALDKLLQRLDSSPEGLSASDAEQRLGVRGFNEPRHPRFRATMRELIRAVANPLNVILLIAAGASSALGAVTDAIIIASIVAMSSGLYFWQTFRSERAMRALQETLAPTATVRRDGQWTEIPRRQIVPGDVIRLSAGDLVPADARLLQASDLHVQQAALTGESMPTEKHAESGQLSGGGAGSPGLVFLGTSVVSGTATAVVFAAGSETAYGSIVETLAARPEETDFERGMRQFSMLILRTVIFFVLFVLVVNIAVGRDAFQSLLFTVALAVGLTPEFLPMITTVTLAQGALQMARAKVIVKHLPAIQNLGSIDVLCTDKTGTLTVGAMSAEQSLDPFGNEAPRALALAALNSAFETGIRSPLDTAILQRWQSLHPDFTHGYCKTDELPFDFERRRLSVVVECGHDRLFVSKGAPENIVSVCGTYEAEGSTRPLDDETRRRSEKAFRELSERGLRVLAVGYKNVPVPDGFTCADEQDLTFAGFVTFSDPMLEGVSDCVRQLAQDGVRVKILTGDNEQVTRHVCAQAGLATDRIVTGDELESMDVAALARLIETVDVFARLSPAQKHRVLRTLRAQGHVVGYLGDGINDAPSLHAADVGISAAGAVDVAREASDIILLERRLDVLHAGIVAGRRSFGNVLKYLLMGTSSNFGNMFSMAGAALWLPFLPMRPTQILLTNFLYDLAQVTIPTDKVDAALIRRPQRWNARVIRNFMLIVGPVSSMYDFLTFYVLLHVFGFGEQAFQTGWFVESLATQTLVLFVIRTAGRPWRHRPSKPLATTTLLVVALGAALPYTPLGPPLGLVPLPAAYFAFLAVVVLTYLIFVEIVKRVQGASSAAPSL